MKITEDLLLAYYGMKTALKAAANRLLAPFGFRLVRSNENNLYFSLLTRILEKQGRVSFIQIGANDGKSFDPLFQFLTLYKREVTGYALEPLPDLFAQLQKTYRVFPKVKSLQIAIHATAAEAVIYRVDPKRLKELPPWAKGIASFDEGHHRKSGIADEFIIREPVPCMSLMALLAEHNISELDLLQIDTEGYDAEIIGQIDFTRTKPALIKFETGFDYSIMPEEVFGGIKVRLQNEGYEFFQEAADVIAYRKEAF